MSQAPPIVATLIDRFEQNRDSYKSQSYNETQVRREFLDPFFEALGWDIANKQGHAEAYKDVIHEDAIKIGGNTKAPDYCFRVGGARKFFLEAKKPAVNVKDEIPPAYQLRRYAWSAKLPLSILTDFEEFAVYDCRTRPNPTDKPSAGRILYLTYREYLTRWDEIASIFTKEAVLKGSFDKYAVTDRKRGTATVDAEFLKEIETWRESLAKNLALRNPALTVHELNFSVQRTIDRLIFLRICEDRGVEPYGQLQALLNGQNIYGRLRYLYEQADDRYNSGLFHFHKEQGRAESPDDLTPSLKIDDKVLKEILGRLYYPQSPYEFSVLPTEILGQVYEQFLGKVIRLTSGHQAKIEEKPEVKKAGGVYYTPAYIVEYIVKQTVGVLCDGKTPKQIAKLTVLDPACGSGSFLLGAYRYLLTYHRDWYLKDGQEKHRKELFQTASGEWRLTTQEKKRILLNNIYGVDIDSQAVEVTKLSLLLKVLEGESDETLKRQLSFVHERALPDLGQNIKCGNSLIGPDYFSGQLMPDDEEMRRVNPFDWKAEFPHIFPSPSGRGQGEGAGGFDAVIGNPPYVRVSNIEEEVRPYLYKRYDITHRFDIYVVFVLRSYQLLSAKGHLGFILPNKFFTADYGKNLRDFLSSSQSLRSIVDFGDSQVFPGASTYTCLLFLSKEPHSIVKYKSAIASPSSLTVDNSSLIEVDLARFSGEPWSFESSQATTLLGRLKGFPCLGKICEIKHGLQTGLDEIFLLQVVTPNGNSPIITVTSKASPEAFEIERSITRRLVKGSLDIRRYSIDVGGRLVLFPYSHESGKALLIQKETIEKSYPLAWKYLKENYDRLRARNNKDWHAFRRRNYDLGEGFGRILVPSIGKRLMAGYDAEGSFHFVGSGGGGGGAYGLTLKPNVHVSQYYVLGVLNSRMADWLAKLANSRFGGGYYSFNRQYIEPIPIRPIDFKNSNDKASHDHLVALVERMLDLHKRSSGANTPADKDRLQRQIDVTDQEIDRLVYGLYGLTEEELAIVEAASVATSSKVKENDSHDESHTSAGESHSSQRQVTALAPAARRSGDEAGSVSGSNTGLGGGIDEIRERTGDYGPPSGTPGQPEEHQTGSVGSTRYLDTAEGPKLYTEVAERLAVSLTSILRQIVESDPATIHITSEWLCLRHRELAGALFPDWAGRFRDRNVQIGRHQPPPCYEVPVHMRLLCDDLAERVRQVRSEAPDLRAIVELLAMADGRFQSIHPFQDFNGRVGRVLLITLMHVIGLPDVQIIPEGPEFRRTYLEALNAADRGEYELLTEMWLRRLDEGLS